MGLRATSGAARRFGYGALLAALMGSVGTGAIGLALGSASAQSSQQARFDIPAGPLSAALPAFGSQSGLQITYLPSVAKGKNSPGVSGTVTRGDALSRILQGSGLTWQFTNATTVAISAPAAAPASGVPTDGSLVLDTISVQGENARGGFEGYVPTRSATAAKTDTPFIESPQTVAVVGRDQMEDQGITTVSESLRYSSGVLTETAGGQSRRFDSFFIRGVGGFGSAAQYASWVDGMRWAFPLRTAVQIDPYLLERVEVMKGPSSALYGQGSAGGFVNMISKTPSLDAKNEVFTTIGSHNRVEAGFDLSGALDENNEWLYRIVGLGRMADAQIDFQRDERVAIAPSLTWQPTDDTTLTIQAMYHHDPQAPDTAWIAPMGSLDDIPGYGKLPRNFYQGDPNWMEFKRTQASLGYQFDHRFNDTFKFHSNARFGYMENSQKTISDNHSRWPFSGEQYSAPNEIPRQWSIGEMDGWSFAIDNNVTAEFDTGPVSHKLLGGVDHMQFSGSTFSAGASGNCQVGYRCEFDQPQRSWSWYGGSRDWWYWDAFNPKYGLDVGDMATFADMIRNGTAWADSDKQSTWKHGLKQTGIYFQDQMEWDRWRLALTGRYDWSAHTDERYVFTNGYSLDSRTVKDQAFTGRAMLAYAFDNGWLPFASYATSFDPVALIPATLNTKGYKTFPQGPVPFEPERGSGYELGLRYQSPDTGLYLSATYFNGKKEKFAVPTFGSSCVTSYTHPTCYTQETEAKAQGVELEARGEVLPGLSILANYTYTDAKLTRLSPSDEDILSIMKDPSMVPPGFDPLPAGFRPSPVGMPKHMASLYANYTFNSGSLDGLSIGGGVRYVGEAPAHLFNVWIGSGFDTNSDPAIMLKRAYVPSRTLFDLSLSYDFGKKFANLDGLSLNVAATNVFDKKYVAACNGYGSCTYGDGRDIRATLRYRW